MRKVILSMMMSLDGFVSGPNDEMDWLPPFNDDALWEDIHKQMWDNLRLVDTLLLGRATYQIWEKYWPAAATNPASTKNDLEFSRYADEAEEAVNFYTSIFKNSKKGRVTRYGEAGAKVSGRPKGSVMTVTFELEGQEFHGRTF
jgi:dihydrofolate reductase